jgi:glycosyltransferase involved in cell wall biosynthesis
MTDKNLPEKSIKVGIDASNIRSGGAIEHLCQILDPENGPCEGISAFLVWGNSKLLDRLPEDPLIEKVSVPAANNSNLRTLMFQLFSLPKLSQLAGCDVLFAPGGITGRNLIPTAVMSQNLLPFEETESKRYGVTKSYLRLLALRIIQGRTFKRADKIIFLSEYAREVISRELKLVPEAGQVIPHGMRAGNKLTMRHNRTVESCDASNPFRILYVSPIDVYKHQEKVVQACNLLRTKLGWQINLRLVGPPFEPAWSRLQRLLKSLPDDSWVSVVGGVSSEEVEKEYLGADLAVFVSTCENLPITLLEIISHRLPVVSSTSGPMPEILGTGAAYCDPLDPADMSRALERVILDIELRRHFSTCEVENSYSSSWQRAKQSTLNLLTDVARVRSNESARTRAN